MAQIGRLNKLRSTLLYCGVLVLFCGCGFNDFEDIKPSESDPWRVNSSIYGGLSVTDEPFVNEIIVEGVVVSSDSLGNFYKEVILDDPYSREPGALKLKFSYYDIFSVYPLGALFAINLKGMVIWSEEGILTAGFKNEEGQEGGRIPSPTVAKKIIHSQGKSCVIDYIPTTIDEIKEKGIENAPGGVVNLRSCYFTEQMGMYSGEREIAQEGSESKISLYTSPYAMFSNRPVLEGLFDIDAIVIENNGKLQLKINELSDLEYRKENLTYIYR